MLMYLLCGWFFSVLASSTIALQAYQIVHFINEDTEEGTRSIDCIPNSWIIYDVNIGSCMAKFLPPPYTKETKALLYSRIKANDEAPVDWPYYQVSLLGHASEISLFYYKKFTNCFYLKIFMNFLFI